MSEKIKQILEIAIEFCREQSQILMIGGAVLVVLIILISIISSVRKKTKDEDLDFYEEDFLSTRKSYNQGENGPHKEKHTEVTTDDVAALLEAFAQEESVEQPVKKPHSISEPEDAKVIEHVHDNIEGFLGEIARLPAKDLEAVEINIQGIEVKLKYSNKNSEEPKENLLGSSQQECNPKATIDNEQPLESINDSEEANTAILDSLIKNQGTEAVTIKKFGPNNTNRTKSGQIFTEEELEKQIKD